MNCCPGASGTDHGEFHWYPSVRMESLRAWYRTSAGTRRYPTAMPMYEYACTKCSHQFEELVSASGSTVVACPVCNSGKVDKLFSTFQRVRVGGGGLESAPAPTAGRAGGCCGGGCGCG